MATKRLSGRCLAADIRSGMDCVALTEKYDLSVAQLRKAVGTIVSKGILAAGERPAWMSEDRPWKCPKCGRGQSERFARCPICGVIIEKLGEIIPATMSSHLSGSTVTTAPSLSEWKDEPPRSRVSATVLVVAISAICLVIAAIAFRPAKGPSEAPTGPAVAQADKPLDTDAPRKRELSHEEVAYAGLKNDAVDEAIFQSPKARRIAKLAHEYRKTHTYSTFDQFACVDMSIDLWNQIQTAGIRAGLMAGNVRTDITGARDENFIQYVAQMNHAWVVAEIEPGRWLPVEATAGGIVSPQDMSYWRYFSGEFFNNPGEFKQFEELRRNLFTVCSEAKEMHKNFKESLQLNQPRTKEAVLEAFRAHGKLEQRAQDCKALLQRIEQVLHSRSEKVVPWTTE